MGVALGMLFPSSAQGLGVGGAFRVVGDQLVAVGAPCPAQPERWSFLMQQPTGQVVTVTGEFLARGMSDRGGWTRAQLAILGVGWPPSPGWRIDAAGKRLTQEQADEFLALRNQLKPRGTRPPRAPRKK